MDKLAGRLLGKILRQMTGINGSSKAIEDLQTDKETAISFMIWEISGKCRKKTMDGGPEVNAFLFHYLPHDSV